MHFNFFKLQTLLLPFAVATMMTTSCTDGSGDSDADTDTNPTTTATATDSSSSSSSGGETEAAMGACMTYCSNAMANCTGSNAVYADMDQCMSSCAAMPEGKDGDVDGDSAWCRAYHAGDPAMGDPDTHCQHASANGGGACGSYCDAYCDQTMANCNAANEVYTSADECMAACAAFPSDGAFNATDGNSVQCRTYHASFPAAADADSHCQHTSSNGGGACGELCQGYCSQAMANCGDLYADEAACMTTCAGFPTDGAWNDKGGDSVQCRTYHASFPAAADAATHCAHAAADGGGICE